MTFPVEDLRAKSANIPWNRTERFQVPSVQFGSAGQFDQQGKFNPSDAAQNFLVQYQKDNPDFNPVEVKPLAKFAEYSNLDNPSNTLGLFTSIDPDSIYLSDPANPKYKLDPNSTMSTFVHELQHRTDHFKGSFGFNGKPFYSAPPSPGNMERFIHAKHNQSSDFRDDMTTIIYQPSSLGAANSAKAELSARLAEKEYLKQMPNSSQNLENWKQDPWTPGYPIYTMDKAADTIINGKMNPLPVFVDNDTYPYLTKPASTTPMKLATEALPYLDTQSHFFGNEVFNRIYAD